MEIWDRSRSYMATFDTKLLKVTLGSFGAHPKLWNSKFSKRYSFNSMLWSSCKQTFCPFRKYLATNTLYIKFLEVTIDERLNWKLHADQVSSKMSKPLVVIRGMRQVLLKKLHYALIYPHFTHGIVVWGKASKLKFQDTFELQTLKRMHLYFHNMIP